MTGGPFGGTVDVALAVHTWERLGQILRAVEGVNSGSRRPGRCLVVVDRAPDLAEFLAARLRGEAEVFASAGAGASAARNAALARSRADVVAFLDDDARPAEGWLEALLQPFQDAAVTGAGGRIAPDYRGGRPLPAEVLWLVGATYTGHRTTAGPITRPIGANMALRREAVQSIGGFPEHFGPAGVRRSSSNEELALCLGLRARFGPDCIQYAPDALVYHAVPATRTALSYVLHRSWVEGTSKADVRQYGGASELGHDRDYLQGVMLPSIARTAAAGARGDWGQFRTSATLSGVLLATGAGYVSRRLRQLAGRGAPSS